MLLLCKFLLFLLLRIPISITLCITTKEEKFTRCDMVNMFLTFSSSWNCCNRADNTCFSLSKRCLIYSSILASPSAITGPCPGQMCLIEGSLSSNSLSLNKLFMYSNRSSKTVVPQPRTQSPVNNAEKFSTDMKNIKLVLSRPYHKLLSYFLNIH